MSTKQPNPKKTPKQTKPVDKKKRAGCNLAILGAFAVAVIAILNLDGPAEDTNTATPTSDTTTTAPVKEQHDAMPWLEQQFGMSPAEAITQDPSVWYGYVSGAHVEGSRLHAQLQVDRVADKALGEQAAKALANFVMFSDDPLVAGVDWAIAENGVGEHIAQETVRR